MKYWLKNLKKLHNHFFATPDYQKKVQVDSIIFFKLVGRLMRPSVYVGVRECVHMSVYVSVGVCVCVGGCMCVY